MDNSKLISLLQTFSKKELREFSDFVASPFFNKNEELIRFYTYLRKYAPHFPLKKIARRTVYAALYPDKAYDDKQLNYLMSFLLKLSEEYISYGRFKEKGEASNLLGSYVDRGLDKHYQYTLKAELKKLEGMPYRDRDFYYQQYLIADIDNEFFLKHNIRKYDERIQKAADNLDLYYLSTKLKYSCEMIDRDNWFKDSYTLQLLDEITDYLEKYPHEKVPSISIYQELYFMLTRTDSDVHFKRFRELFDKYQDKFKKQEVKKMYRYGINYAIRRLNERKLTQEAIFELYDYGIKSELLFEKGYLTPFTYKNFIKLGLALKRYSWTEEFILNYNKKLAPEFRQNAMYYNLAELYYYKKDFDKAQDCLNQVEYTEVHYALGSKKLFLKIFYELEEDEVLYSSITAFKIYLKRNKSISESIREAYLKFVGILGLLTKRNPKQGEMIFKQIKETEVLPDRKWLLRMFEQHYSTKQQDSP